MLYDVLSAAYPVTNARASDWEKEFAEVQPSLNARTHTCIYIYIIYIIFTGSASFYYIWKIW